MALKRLLTNLACAAAFAVSTADAGALRGLAEADGPSDRDLELSQFVDPKDIVLKAPANTPQIPDFSLYDLPWTYPLNGIQIPRPINILSFGGSVTWGATLEDRHGAYPWLIGTPYIDHVDNMAMRATGADYPSICLESIIPDSGTKNYDVIMFDFVMNGTDGFPKLLERLRARYPDAIIIYVHIWSILNLAYDADTRENARQANFDPDRNWQWASEDTFNGHGAKNCGREICSAAEMEKLVEDAGGIIWKMPLPETPKIAIESGWFSDDWHHLAAKGHRMIAQSLLNLLQPMKAQVFRPKQLGTWGAGDQCYNWFQSGEIDVEYTHAKVNDLLAGQSVNLGDPDFKKVTLEFDPVLGGSISFVSKFDKAVPIGLAYMSIAEPADYQVVDVKVGGSEAVRIDPSVNTSSMKAAHITIFSHIGLALPGDNTITISPVDQRKNPFRVIGVYLCGDCAPDSMGSGAVNSAIAPPAPLGEQQ